MIKYRYIYTATLMESLHYIMSILLSFALFFIIIFVFINLWTYLYSSPSNVINGYSLKQMLWYVILTEIIWFGARNPTLSTQMINDIKSGSIAYGINKPYNYILYVIAKHLGEITLRLIMFFCAGIIIGLALIGSIPHFTLLQLPFAVVSFFLGVLINSFIYMSISCLSFWIEDSTPFRWIYEKMLIVIGTLFPVELFPRFLQPAIKCSPIYVINYGPSKLIIDFSFATASRIFFAQALYLIGTILILTILFSKGVKKLNVNGG